MNQFLLFALLLFHTFTISAGEVDVLKVSVDCSASCRFSVTLKHADSGWKHYANKWEVVTKDGKVLATRLLAHPHVDEQPFTRSLGNVKIPPAIDTVIIRATDSLHGTGGKEYQVNLSR